MLKYLYMVCVYNLFFYCILNIKLKCFYVEDFSLMFFICELGLMIVNGVLCKLER